MPSVWLDTTILVRLRAAVLMIEFIGDSVLAITVRTARLSMFPARTPEAHFQLFPVLGKLVVDTGAAAHFLLSQVRLTQYWDYLFQEWWRWPQRLMLVSLQQDL